MKLLSIVVSIIISVSVFAQPGFNKTGRELNNLFISSSDSDEYLVWVFFNDKGENLSKYFSNPETVVSQRSLKRRSKVLPQNELINELDLPVNQGYITQLESIGFKVKQVTRWFNGVSGYINRIEASELSKFSFVKKLDLVKKYKKNEPVELYDNYQQQGSNYKIQQPEGTNSYNYGPSYNQLEQIKVPEVHDLGFIGQGVLICSMDAGFDNLAHECFDSMNIVNMWDFVDNDPDPSQLGSHGTKTLSLIGGFKEGQLIGSAFGADYLLARTENDNGTETPVEEDNWIAALEWADAQGVDVTTTSLSYLDYDPPFTSYTWQDMDGNTAMITIAADLAVKLGIVVVNSASNNGFDPNHNTLGAPADGDSVITVGAVDESGNRAGYSSVGPTADGRIKPDLMAMGSGCYYASSSSTSGYGNFSVGTSFSCPILAGAAALLLSVDNSLTPMELLDLFRQTASQSSNPDNLMGWGIINTIEAANQLLIPVELTLFSGSYVHGEVVLNWTTATEKNNYGFEIEKRYNNNMSFNKIGFVPGNGTISFPVEYSFSDTDLISNHMYYRLKQIDYNGNFKYSDEILVEVSDLDNFKLFQNYPNPFNPSTLVKYSLPIQSKVKISVFDIIGNEIEVLYEGVQQSGIHEINFNAEGKPSGIYFISFVSDRFSQTIKATLLK